MNGFAIKVGELILWEMKATPWILYLKPLKRTNNIIFETKSIKMFNFGVLGSRGLNIYPMFYLLIYAQGGREVNLVTVHIFSWYYPFTHWACKLTLILYAPST